MLSIPAGHIIYMVTNFCIIIVTPHYLTEVLGILLTFYKILYQSQSTLALIVSTATANKIFVD
jgi:hypothetical protein